MATRIDHDRAPAPAGPGALADVEVTSETPPGPPPAPPTRPAGRWRGRGGQRAHLSGKAKLGLGIIAFFLLLAVFGPLLAPMNPSAVGAKPLQGPSLAHLLGTTQTGQDVLSQLLVGARSTVFVGLLAGLVATALSVGVGVSAGFLGGASDEGLSLLSNVFLVLPALPLLIVVLSELRSSSDVVVALVIALTGWPWGARVLRAQTLSLRRRDFVLAARESGESTWRIVVAEILPNEVAVIAASLVGTVIFAIITTVTLAFLGLLDPSRWSWGTMLYWAQSDEALSAGAWWWFVPPGLCVAVLGMGLALTNFAIDEYSNPRLREGDQAVRSRRSRRPRLTDPTPYRPELATRAAATNGAATNGSGAGAAGAGAL
ncbi:MAG: ABC transporter permease [Actinomycetota bacterium]|nr:ABC transporter permease [Actinomycetota bacterium]